MLKNLNFLESGKKETILHKATAKPPSRIKVNTIPFCSKVEETGVYIGRCANIFNNTGIIILMYMTL